MALMNFQPDILDDVLDKHIAYLAKQHIKNLVMEAREEDARRSAGEDES